MVYIRNDYSNIHSNHIVLDSRNTQKLIRIFSINIVSLDQMLKHPNKLEFTETSNIKTETMIFFKLEPKFTPHVEPNLSFI
jgi:hypothetical protein